MAQNNVGDVSEGILGCAVIAKLVARTGDSVRKITANDVRTHLLKLKTGRITSRGALKFAEKAFDFGGGIEDTFTITLRLTEPAFDLLFPDPKQKVDPVTAQRINTVIQSAVSYVNSREIESKATQFFMDREEDDICIEVDGISKSSGTKADIIISNNKVTFSKVSLKTISKQFGQVYGGPFTNYVRLFEGGSTRVGNFHPGLGLPISSKQIEEEFDKLAVQKAKDRNEASVIAVTKFMYGEAAKLIMKQSRSTLAADVVDFLNYHTTQQDDLIKIVVLDRIMAGRHKVLDPKLLAAELRKATIRVNLHMEGVWPILYFYIDGSPPTTIDKPNCLFDIRPKWSNRDRQVQNLVEKGPLMTTLAMAPDE